MEVIEVLGAALDAVGLEPGGDRARRRRPLPASSWTSSASGSEARARDPRPASPRTTSSGSRRRSRRWTSARAERETLLRLPTLRGGAEVLEQARELGGEAVERAIEPAQRRPTRRSRERGIADRVQLDLGLLRDLGYYTGAILEVYDPALGHILGGGGRYDELDGPLRPAAAGGRLRALPRAPAHRPGGGGANRPGEERELGAGSRPTRAVPEGR